MDRLNLRGLSPGVVVQEGTVVTRVCTVVARVCTVVARWYSVSCSGTAGPAVLQRARRVLQWARRCYSGLDGVTVGQTPHPDPYHGGTPLHARPSTTHTPGTSTPCHHPYPGTSTPCHHPYPQCRDRNASFDEIDAKGVLQKTTVCA